MRKYNEKMIIRNGKMKYYCCYFKPFVVILNHMVMVKHIMK